MHVIYPVVGIEWIDGMVFVSNASVAGCAFRACIPNKYRVMHWCYSFSDQPTNFKQRSFQIKPRFATKLFFFNFILHRSFETINLFFFTFFFPFFLPYIIQPSENFSQQHVHVSPSHPHYSKKLSSNPWISDKERVPILRSSSISSKP